MNDQEEDFSDVTPEADEAVTGERIAKVLARAGICSRRDAEKMIAARRVAVNGMVLSSPAHNVTGSDQITVDGEPLTQPQEVRFWRYHKPAGLVTTHKDPQGRATVFDVLPRDLPRVVSVGRLDLNSEGLLLLTNDGSLAGLLEHPNTGWPRRYRVRVHGRVDERKLATLANGVEVDGVQYGPIEAVVERLQDGANCWLQVTLREGKNREIRRVMEHLGYTVNRLIRVSYGPFVIGRLARGQVEEVPFKVLRDALDGLGDGVPEELRMEKINTSKWAKAKARPVRPGYKKIVRARGTAGAEGEDRVTEARKPRPNAGPGRPQDGRSQDGRSQDGRSQDGRSQGGRPAGGPRGEGRPEGGRPGGRSDGGRPDGGRSDGGRSGGRPFGDKPRGEGRSDGGRPEGRPEGGRPAGRSDGGRPDGGRSGGGRSDGGRSGGRPFGDKPRGEGRSDGGRPEGRSNGGRPEGGRPSGRPGGRPQGGGPRGDGPRGDGPRGNGPRGGSGKPGGFGKPGKPRGPGGRG